MTDRKQKKQVSASKPVGLVCRAWALAILLVALGSNLGATVAAAWANAPFALSQAAVNKLPTPPEPPIKFERISIEQGLSQSSISCILQDSQGFMWFGTGDGLNRYDGYEFTVYKHDPANPYSPSSNRITTIFEDKDKRLWVSYQDGGLDQYDPQTGHFGHYLQNLHPSINPNQQPSFVLYQDRAGTLWLGTFEGLFKYDRQADQFIQYRHDPALNPQPNDQRTGKQVNAIYEDQAGELWLGTNDGLIKFDRETERFTIYPRNPSTPLSPAGSTVVAIQENDFGTFWVASAYGGVGKFSRDTEQFTLYQNEPGNPNSLRAGKINDMYVDQRDRVWIQFSSGGLDRFDPQIELFTHYEADPNDSHSLSRNTVEVMAEDQAGNLWVGTQDGLNRFNWPTGNFTQYRNDPNDPNSLSNNSITALYQDRAGALWIGTWGQGISRLDPQSSQFTHYQIPPQPSDSLNRNTVSAIYQDQAGMLWTGTRYGLNQLDPITNKTVWYRHDPKDPHSLGNDWVLSIAQGPAESLWIGTMDGLDKFDPASGRFTHYPEASRISDKEGNTPFAILSLYQDSLGTLWIGTNGAGLAKLVVNQSQETGQQTEKITLYQLDPSDSRNDLNPHNLINVIFQDQEGILWLGTYGGLDKLDSAAGTFASYQHNPNDLSSLSKGEVLSIKQDRSGTLWIGTNGGGLNRFDRETKTFTHYTEKDGLPNSVIYAILADDLGNLWLSTNNGLSKFNPQTKTIRNYDQSDGLQSNEFNVGAYYQASDGRLFFGGVNGLNILDPAGIQDNAYIPPIVLSSLTQGGLPIALDQAVEGATAVTLGWPDNFFEFEFAALNYSQPQKNQYAYMLENFDRGWNYIGARRFGRYTNLPGGNYTLRLKGSNNDGVWNEQGLALKITVLPPFWESWWFRGLVGLIVLGSVIGGYQWRVRNIAAKNRELEALVAERAYALEQRTLETEQRQQELEALYRADAELHRHLHLEQVLQTLVDTAVDILHADKGSLMVWDEQRRGLVLRASHGFSPHTIGQMFFAPGQGVAGLVATTGELVIVEDTHTDPRASRHIVEPEGIYSFMQVPIKIGGQVFGVFSADYTQPHAFQPAEKRLLIALAQRAALAIENAQLYEQAQESAVVEERSRLARDLHDAVTQTLFSASLIAEALPNIWETDPNEGRQLLGEMRRLSRGALAEMRSLLLELRPTALVEASLGDLLRQLAEAVTGRKDVSVSVTIEGQCSLPPDVHVALYRIAQEALNNIVKHAHAKNVTVGLHCTALAACRPTPSPYPSGQEHGIIVELAIRDDGCGFALDRIAPNRMGLGIIRERAQAIGAELEIKSQINQGTSITVIWSNKKLVNGE